MQLAPLTSTMPGGDRLSDLHDDILRRVLYFAPAKEASSTSALSRRWRSLWRSSGAVNLDATASLREAGEHNSYEGFLSRRDAFVSTAEAALASADDIVKRLTFHAEANGEIGTLLHSGMGLYILTELLSHPAALRVEDLRISLGLMSVGIYGLSLGCLPSETLRVLDLTNCGNLTLPAAVAFPRLASLRLHHCTVRLEPLQGVIDDAPALTTVHLESVLLERTDGGRARGRGGGEERILRLRFSAAKELVLVLLENITWMREKHERRGGGDVEIDAPRLQRFRYKGLLRQLSLSSPAPDLARADFHFLAKYICPVSLWQYVQNFINAKCLKVRVNERLIR